tara:strand:- start:9610 stop:9924 length:315 start_codon:yes stop_codon:yes gene_type:complete
MTLSNCASIESDMVNASLWKVASVATLETFLTNTDTQIRGKLSRIFTTPTQQTGQTDLRVPLWVMGKCGNAMTIIPKHQVDGMLSKLIVRQRIKKDGSSKFMGE